MEFIFRKATLDDLSEIWTILKDAIKRRKEEGSMQWQDGYPNLEVIKKDIGQDAGFVLADGNIIAGYCSILVNDEPSYSKIDGKWLTNADFVVFHRVAITWDRAYP